MIDLFATVGLHLDKQDQLHMCIGSENVGLGTGINIGQLGKKVLYSSKASATGGIPSMGCEGVALTNDSGMTYVVNSANMVARAARLAMLMLDEAFNK